MTSALLCRNNKIQLTNCSFAAKNNADITLFKKLTSALPLFIVCLENYFSCAAR